MVVKNNMQCMSKKLKKSDTSEMFTYVLQRMHGQNSSSSQQSMPNLQEQIRIGRYKRNLLQLKIYK
jgi:hypothetical protein